MKPAVLEPDEAKVFVRIRVSDSRAVLTSTLVHRYRIFGNGHYWGTGQKTIDSAWVSAALEIQEIECKEKE